MLIEETICQSRLAFGVQSRETIAVELIHVLLNLRDCFTDYHYFIKAFD